MVEWRIPQSISSLAEGRNSQNAMTGYSLNSKNYSEVVGIIPAGGQGSRLGLPCSKELFPIGFRMGANGESVRPKVVCHDLLQKMQETRITKTYIILRDGKWDIPQYLGDGSTWDMHVAYLIMSIPFGVPYTIDQAYPFVRDALVAFGFPDIVFEPNDAFQRLLVRQEMTKADVVLGLFEAPDPHKVDMVECDEKGRVRKIIIKPTSTFLQHSWIIAVWTPKFTEFMHKYLSSVRIPERQELFIGDVIQSAIDEGLEVDSVYFPDGSYVDIGTPQDLFKAVCSNVVEEGYGEPQSSFIG